MTKFGLQLPNFTFSGVPDEGMFEHVAELAVAGEESGFDSLWVMDHYWQLPPLGGPTQPMLEAYTLLGGLAAHQPREARHAGDWRDLPQSRPPRQDGHDARRRLRGSGDARHRRGLVRGRARRSRFRLPDRGRAPRPSRRGVADLPGDVHRGSAELRRHALPDREGAEHPRPIQRNGPRIMVGGSGEKRTLWLVAQYADLCNIHGSPDTVRRLLDVLRHHCADVAAHPAEITTTRLGSLFLSSSPEEAEQTSGFLRDAAGAEFEERFTVGEPAAVLDQVGGAVDAGLDASSSSTCRSPTRQRAARRRAARLRFG